MVSQGRGDPHHDHPEEEAPNMAGHEHNVEGHDHMHPHFGERGFEMGMDEFYKTFMAELANNHKRTYDAYQDLDLIAARRSQEHHDADRDQARRHAEELHAMTMQMMQHANERISSHRDLFADRVWNLDEVARVAAGVDPGNTALINEMVKAVSQNGPITPAILAEMVKAVSEVAKDKK